MVISDISFANFPSTQLVLQIIILNNFFANCPCGSFLLQILQIGTLAIFFQNDILSNFLQNVVVDNYLQFWQIDVPVNFPV